jgi:C4-dicarboxylate-specific signal transduction histidine kinase
MEEIANEKLAELLNNLEVGLILIDSNHNIHWMNDKVQEWFGPLKLGEKRKCYRIQKYNENFCRICPTRRAINFGIPTRYDLTFELEDGPCCFEIIGMPVSSNNDNSSLVMELIINKSKLKIERKETKDIIAQMEKMASIGNLAAGIAHELCTPLATMSIISQELNDILKKNKASNHFKEDISGYLYDIDTEIKRCKSIIENVQNFARKGLHQRNSVNIADILSQTTDLIYNSELPEGVVIKKDVGICPQVNTDPGRLRQVILNILKNAVHAVSLSKSKKEIVISLKRENQSIVILIKDSGSGIPQRNLKRLFEPFFTTKPAGMGTGLGLFVSYGIMKDLGGDIKIKSKAETGTSVFLILPVE